MRYSNDIELIQCVFNKFYNHIIYDTAYDCINNLNEIDDQIDENIPIYQIKFYAEDSGREGTDLINREPNYHHNGTWYRNNVCVCMEKAIYVAYYETSPKNGGNS